MKKRTKIILASTGAVAVLVLGTGGYVVYRAIVPRDIAIDDNASAQSNFYQYINNDWLKTIEIPSDQGIQNAFGEISDAIEDNLKKDVKDWVSGKIETTSNDQKEFVELYQLATDFKQREKDGVEPVKVYLDRIEKLSSFEEFKEAIPDLILENFYLPFSIVVSSNPHDSTAHMIDLSGPTTILPDVSYYQNEATKKQLLSVYQKSAEKVLTLMDYSEEEAKSLVEDTIAFDALIVPYIPSSEELSEIENSVNVTASSEVKKFSKTLAFDQFINQLVGQEVDEINVSTPKYMKAVDKIVNEKNFKLMKSWILVSEAMSSAPALTEDLRQASSEFGKFLTGVAETPSKTDSAFTATTNVFAETISVHYGQKYFGQAAKDDVTSMIDGIIEVYKSRLSQNDWLSEDTKTAAVRKLDSMNYYIGYPEEVSEATKEIDIDPEKTYYENLVMLRRDAITYNFAKYNEPVDKSQWGMPSYMVNAYYTPIENAIYFPAAILQAPFYAAKQSKAENYGGIGAVIGHEITHAFDNNGAQFDEKGDMQDWWTKEDYKAFEAKTKEMENLFDGIEIYGSKVNGKLTVSENIADAGGLSASFEALKKVDSQADAKEYFENWARIWRQKSTEQIAQYLMTVDTHAPNELRANVQLKNFSAFYQSYDIKEDDPMYLAEKDRVSIW